MTSISRCRIESVALVGAVALALGSAFRPSWYFVDAAPQLFFLLGDWTFVWFGQIAAIVVVVTIALLSVFSRCRGEVELRVGAGSAVALVVVEMWLVHEQIRETNVSLRGWAAPGDGLRWLLMASLLLLAPHVRRPTGEWVRAWLDRWR